MNRKCAKQKYEKINSKKIEQGYGTSLYFKLVSTLVQMWAQFISLNHYGVFIVK
jgi:hypothetical protein